MPEYGGSCNVRVEELESGQVPEAEWSTALSPHQFLQTRGTGAAGTPSPHYDAA